VSDTYTELTTIPKIRRVDYTTYATFPTTGLKVGDLAYATDLDILYRWNGAGWDTLSSQGDFPPNFIDYSTINVYQRPGWKYWHYEGAAPTVDKIYMYPIFVTKSCTFDRIGVKTLTAFAAGSKARLGIYSNKQGTRGILPDALIIDAGQVAIDVLNTIVLAVINWNLARGVYWLAYIVDHNGGGLRGLSRAGYNANSPFEGTGSDSDSSSYFCLSKTGCGAYNAGGLPASAPDPNSYETTDRNCPFLRLA
jgi:hypothetical protein